MPLWGKTSTTPVEPGDALRVKHTTAHASLGDLLDGCQQCFDSDLARFSIHFTRHLTHDDRRARRMFLRGW